MYHTIYIAEHDLVSAQKLHATPRPLVAASLLALVLTGIASAYATGHLPLRAAIGAVAGISGLLALQFIVLIPYHARRKYQQRTFLHQLHHVRWDEECIHIRCGHTHGRIPWADFRKVKENRDMLLLYRSGTLFNIFPKRCFADYASLEDFRAHLASVGMVKPSAQRGVSTLRAAGD